MSERSDLRARFESFVSPEPTSGCWLWTGAIMSGGYGGFHVETGRTARAHRVAYELERGPIPAGKMLDHRCHNRACVNVAHLRLATRRQNNSNLAGKGTARFTSAHTGVSWHTANRRWQATIKTAGRKRHLGYFSDEAAAAQAYQSALHAVAAPQHATPV